MYTQQADKTKALRQHPYNIIQNHTKNRNHKNTTAQLVLYKSQQFLFYNPGIIINEKVNIHQNRAVV